jgi:AAA+ ATPase superfamily predicted ATPase
MTFAIRDKINEINSQQIVFFTRGDNLANLNNAMLYVKQNEHTNRIKVVTVRALEEIKRHLLDFIGTHTWEELCREWVLRAGDLGKLPLPPDQVGSVWTKDVQVDVVGINSMEKSLILGECKWRRQAIGRGTLSELIAKTPEVVPKHGNWRVHYLGFARGGWTKAAQAFANEFSENGLKGENWETAGMTLLDLAQVDHDLTAWSV